MMRDGRPPRRGCGLKCKWGTSPNRRYTVAPLTGVWIEITATYRDEDLPERSPPSRGRGLKFYAPARHQMNMMVAPLAGGRGLKWCCPSQMACCSPFSFIVSFLFPLYISRSKNRPIIPLHSTRRACPPRCVPEASGTPPSLRLLQLAHDLLAHRLLRILRQGILDLRCVIP